MKAIIPARSRWTAIACALVFTSAATGCSSSANRPTITIANAPPYWCHLVPQKALLLTSRNANHLEERNDLNTSIGFGKCMVENDSGTVLSVEMSRGSGALGFYQEENGVASERFSLPDSIGKGSIRRSSVGFLGSSLFKCDTEIFWLKIEIADYATKRNTRDDFTRLFSIAERRYGTLARCTLATEITLTPTMSANPTK